jgi:hypothetical protein
MGSWWTDDKIVIPSLTGLVVAAVTLLMQIRKDRVSRRAERVATQLDMLYGPLHFYLCENADLCKRSHRLGELYTMVYENKNWSERGRQTINEETNQTIDVKNRYTTKVTENNAIMVQMIKEHFSLIVHDDLDALREFVTDYNRYQVEKDLPSRVALQMTNEPIAFFRPIFAEKIAARVNELQRQWRRL